MHILSILYGQELMHADSKEIYIYPFLYAIPSIIGGLGSAVAEVLADNSHVPFERVGIMDRFGQSGKPPMLFEAYGLTSKAIKEACQRVLARKA